MSLYMETTQISAEQTVGEIQKILGYYGAQAILLEYKAKEVAAVSFKIDVKGQEVPFRLPCRWEAIHQTMMRRIKRHRPGMDYTAQSKRVAWRQILRWIQAQMALVETSMVKIEEVFLPYIQTRTGQTMYERLEAGNFLMLEGPERG